MALTFGRCHATKRLTRYVGSSSVSQNGMLSGPGGNVSRPMRDIPGPTGLPFFGSWFRYKLGTLSTYDYHNNLQSLRERHGPIFKETIAGTTVVHLFDPDDFKRVYQSSKRAPHTKPMMQPSKYYRIKRNLGLGLNNVFIYACPPYYDKLRGLYREQTTESRQSLSDSCPGNHVLLQVRYSAMKFVQPASVSQ